MEPSLIDTDILSYYFRNDPNVVAKVNDYLQRYSNLTVSSITCFEILSGLAYKNATRQIEAFERFIQDCEVLNISETSIRYSAKISGDLRRNGITIGNTDLLICGIALEHELTLITHNVRHFAPIQNLKLGNWKR